MQPEATPPLCVNLLLWKEKKVDQAIKLVVQNEKRKKKDGCTTIEKNKFQYSFCFYRDWNKSNQNYACYYNNY